jgi:hypothetical protein
LQLHSFSLDSNDVFKALLNLDSEKGAGPDGVPPSLLKKCALGFSKPGVLNRRAKNFNAYQQKSQGMKLVNSKNVFLINKEQFVYSKISIMCDLNGLKLKSSFRS